MIKKYFLKYVPLDLSFDNPVQYFCGKGIFSEDFKDVKLYDNIGPIKNSLNMMLNCFYGTWENIKPEADKLYICECLVDIKVTNQTRVDHMGKFI